MITVVMTVSATGQALPPAYIFPRARFNDNLMIGSPFGSPGLVNSPTSAWINSILFVKVLEHIKKYSRCSNEDKIILLMDNHESHFSFEAVKYAKENGIILVTFPPHCTHRLQPLDVGIFGPFKSKMKISMNDWMAMNPGKTLKIHDLAHLTKDPFIQSFNQHNNTKAFKKSGLWPFSRLAFTDVDFAASYVTDRPNPEQVFPAPSTHENPDTFAEQSLILSTSVEQPQILSTSLSPTLHIEPSKSEYY